MLACSQARVYLHICTLTRARTHTKEKHVHSHAMHTRTRRALYFEATRAITQLVVTPDNLATLLAMPLHEVMPHLRVLIFRAFPLRGGFSLSGSLAGPQVCDVCVVCAGQELCHLLLQKGQVWSHLPAAAAAVHAGGVRQPYSHQQPGHLCCRQYTHCPPPLSPRRSLLWRCCLPTHWCTPHSLSARMGKQLRSMHQHLLARRQGLGLRRGRCQCLSSSSSRRSKTPRAAVRQGV